MVMDSIVESLLVTTFLILFVASIAVVGSMVVWRSPIGWLVGNAQLMSAMEC